MATIGVRGRETASASAQQDEVTVGLTMEALRPLEAGEQELVAEIDVTCPLEQG